MRSESLNKKRYVDYMKEYAKTPQERERKKKNNQTFQQIYKNDPEWVTNERQRKNEYNKANPDKRTVYAHARRIRKLSAGGKFTSEEWAAMCEHYGNKCLCCGRAKKLTVDHVIPISKGGSNIISNLQPLCLQCNSAKGVKVTDYRPYPFTLEI